jgi:hypothetical protein
LVFLKFENLQLIVWIILGEVEFVTIEHHQVVIALNLDHLVLVAYSVQVIDAFVQFDEVHHHVVV